MSGEIQNKNGKNLKEHVKEMENTIQSLEENMKESLQTDNKVLVSMQSEKIKYQGLSNQLQEALKENQELLNVLQKTANADDLSRTHSQNDMNSSCSTMSIVHLQYKYEELIANHNGLLKVLDMKSEQVKKVHEENTGLKIEIEQLKSNLNDCQDKHSKLLAKYFRLKQRKNEKIHKLKVQRETLQLAHNQLVNVLHNQCMEKDSIIFEEIRKCKHSEKALLLQEIRKNNMLAYENFQLGQQVEFLKAKLKSGKEEY